MKPAMRPLQRILAPIDFSACSDEALAFAAGLAAATGAALTVLHVYEPPGDVAPPGLIGGGWDEAPARALLDEKVAEARRTVERTHGRFFTGEPSRAILSSLASEPADLIVMGTHGRTGLAHLFVGSVAEKVMRRAPCPVVTVRAGTTR